MTADLLVVDTLARLYDCPEDKMLCHVLVVIGRGASVVALPAWNLAARNPNKVAPTRVIRHRPLAIQKRVTFVVDLQFQARAGAVVHVLEALVGLANSRWKLQKGRQSTQQRRPERQHRNTNSSISMMWGVCGNG